jgi:DNA-directed RNA polymerase specialized sigma24 family protein
MSAAYLPEVPLDDATRPASSPPGEQPAGFDDPLIAAIRALPPRQQEVITLRIFFDLDGAATPELLGIPPGTVRAHPSRGLPGRAE